MIKRLLAFFLAGLAIALPFVISGLILYLLYVKVKESVSLEVGLVFGVIAIVQLILIGYLANSYLGSRIFSTVEGWISKLPLMGPLYKSTKDITNAFVGAEGKFSEPVMVEFTGGIYKLGFVTNRDNHYIKSTAQEGTDEKVLLSVYFPLSFSLSGDLFLVPLQRITALDHKANEVMQTIISGGLINYSNREGSAAPISSK